MSDHPHYPPQGLYPQINHNLFYPAPQPPAVQPGPGYPYQPSGQPSFGAPYQPAGQPNFSSPYQPPGQPSFGSAYQPAQPSAPGFSYPGYPNITPTPVYEPIIEWVPTTPANAHTLTERAVVAGYEGHDGSPLWVIRARFNGDLIPGKLAIKHRQAFIPWGGKENPVNDIEVCCARPEKIKWVQSREGVIVPPNAVVAGNTSSGEPLYVGRAKEQGSLTPGKVHPSHKSMYISFAGREIPFKVYEVLCTV